MTPWCHEWCHRVGAPEAEPHDGTKIQITNEKELSADSDRLEHVHPILQCRPQRQSLCWKRLGLWAPVNIRVRFLALYRQPHELIIRAQPKGSCT